MQRAILFDMDGVLVDSEPVILKSAIQGLREYGVEAVPSDFTEFVGAGEDRFVGGVAEKHGAVFVPLQERFDAACKLAPPDYWLHDGVHPTSMGHELIARAWMEGFAKL